MRIVGGRLRGRKLAQPKSQSIRPTTDRNRESLFNIVAHHWPEKLDDTHVLDVFAGTGALGIEALSRGARYGVFMEQSAEGRGLLRENIETMGLTGCTKIFRRDATMPGPVGTITPFDLIFADPPYDKQLGEASLSQLLIHGWIKPDALVLLEERQNSLPDQISGFEKLDARKFGETSIGFFRPIS